MPFVFDNFDAFPKTIPDATDTEAGVMSPADKQKLDGLPSSSSLQSAYDGGNTIDQTAASLPIVLLQNSNETFLDLRDETNNALGSIARTGNGVVFGSTNARDASFVAARGVPGNVDGGDLTVAAGDGDPTDGGKGGFLVLQAGSANPGGGALNKNGGAAYLRGGDAVGSGTAGHVEITGGTPDSGDPGYISITAGSAINGDADGAPVSILAGNGIGLGNGGDASIDAGAAGETGVVGGVLVGTRNSGRVSISSAAGLLGFYGHAPVAKQTVGADTLANVYVVLRALGLIT